MKSLENVSLSKVCKINYGKSPSTILSEDGSFRVIGTGGDERLGNNYLHDGESIIIGRKGTIDKPIYINGKFWPIDTTYYLTDFKEINVKWFYYFLSLIDFNSLNEATGVPSLSRDVLCKISVLKPEAQEEQEAIASILSAVNKVIEQNEHIISKYQRIKTGLMQELLTKGIDEHGQIRSESIHRFKDSQLGRIPEEWKVVKVGEIIDYLGSGITPTGGSKVYQKSGVMLIRSQNVLKGDFDLSDAAFISDEINEAMQRSEVYEFDVLLNITGASIGRSHYIPKHFPKANVNQHVCAIRLKNKSDPKAIFLSTFLNSHFGQNQISKLNAGSNREGLNYVQVKEIILMYPNKDNEFEKIAAILEKQNIVLQGLINNRNKFELLKTGLMQDLLSGRVRIPDKLIKKNSVEHN